MSADIWTNTLGTPADSQHSVKFMIYKGIPYIAQCLNSIDEIKPRPSAYRYEAVEQRITRDTSIYLEVLDEIKLFMQDTRLSSVSAEKRSETDPYWDNGFISEGDARILYAMVGRYRPAQIVEVGAGNSTKFFRKAINDFSVATNLICVDPNPRTEIEKCSDFIIRQSVLDVSLEIFKSLGKGDILFWDGSHVSFNGSDVVRLFLEVIPTLKSGVIVHIHDICLPFAAAVTGNGDQSTSEQDMLAVYLLNNEHCKVIAPVYYLSCRRIVPLGGVSFWMSTGGL
jgi:hypothetical protein